MKYYLALEEEINCQDFQEIMRQYFIKNFIII